MKIEILVNFTNNDYIITGFNGSIEEAKMYYMSNDFTDANEKPITVVGVWEYEEFKADVLQHCLEGSYTALKFDDEQQLFSFKTPQNDFITLSYEKTKHVLNRVEGWTFGEYYSDGWSNPIFETKEKAIEEAKKKYKSSNSRFVEVGWLVNINNQLNVINTEKLVF